MSDLVKFTDRDIEITLYKQNGSKNWYGSFTLNGNRKRFTTKTHNIEKSKKFCYRLIDKLTNPDIIQQDKKIPIKHYMMSFTDLFQSFLKYKRNTGTCQSSTLNDYQIRIKPILKFCGDWSVDEFQKYQSELYGLYLDYRLHNREKFQKYVRNGINIEGRRLTKKITGSSINQEFTIFNMVLTYGKFNLGLFHNWTIPKIQHHRQPENYSITTPTQEEYIKMKRYWIEKGRIDIELWMRLCSNTGMRPSEMRSITVDDIDFENKILHIRNRKKKMKMKTNPLNTQFPITDRLKTIIIDIINITKMVRKQSKNKHLIINLRTGKDLGDFNRLWVKMLESEGLNKRYSPKTLRKYFITKLVKESSIPLSVISDLVGHTNTLTLQKHYLQLRPDDNRKILEHMYLEKEYKQKLTQKTRNRYDELFI